MLLDRIKEVMDADQVIAYAIPVFAVFVFFEMWVRHLQNRKKYDIKDGMASIAMGMGSAVINIGVKIIVLIVYFFIYQYRIFDLGNEWWVWIILIFAEDFSFYMHHRSCHQIRLFWAAHINHHSSTNYNLSTALRQSWGELFHKYIWWLWLPLIGFHPFMIVTMMSISLVYQYFLHTETLNKLGPLEWIMNTPSHHRVHHGSNILYLDRNHAGIFIIWDRLLGTFQKELKEEAVEYGIRGNIHTYNPLKIATHAYVDLIKDVWHATSWKNRIAYLFMPPGWSPDGSTETSDQLRENEAKPKN